MMRQGLKTLATIKMVTPVDKGFLRADNQLLGPDITPGRVGITFYNGRSYAAAVHENLMARHNPPGMAKFIEGPLLMDLPYYPQDILDAAMNILRREAKNG